MNETTELSRPMTGAIKLAIARKNAPVFIKGRRDFFKYRDLGVTGATGGTMRAQITSASQGLSRPTGWHYHSCQAQFVYILKAGSISNSKMAKNVVSKPAIPS